MFGSSPSKLRGTQQTAMSCFDGFFTLFGQPRSPQLLRTSAGGSPVVCSRGSLLHDEVPGVRMASVMLPIGHRTDVGSASRGKSILTQAQSTGHRNSLLIAGSASREGFHAASHLGAEGSSERVSDTLQVPLVNLRSEAQTNATQQREEAARTQNESTGLPRALKAAATKEAASQDGARPPSLNSDRRALSHSGTMA